MCAAENLLGLFNAHQGKGWWAPCPLNKVPNLPSCFFSSFPYSGRVYTLFSFPRNVILFIWVLSTRYYSSLTAQMMSGFCEETHSQAHLACAFFSCSCASMCFSQLVSLHLPTFKAHINTSPPWRTPWFHSPFNPNCPLWSLSFLLPVVDHHNERVHSLKAEASSTLLEVSAVQSWGELTPWRRRESQEILPNAFSLLRLGRIRIGY